MTDQELRARRAELIRAELEANNDTPRWFYISIARPKDEGGFVGGCYIKARGPIEANSLMHLLDLYPRGCDAETMTIDIDEKHQPFTEGLHAEGKTYRLLTAEEVRANVPG